MSFINDFKNDEKAGSHELVGKSKAVAKRKLKPRFSVNLSDEDYEKVKAFCESRGMSCAALARVSILKEMGL